ncbi:MAG: ribose-phosphate diphosphokinase [Candidatus Caldarchaeum sp.]
MKGPSSAQLAEKVARYMNVEAVDVFAKVFPDGESYVRLSGDVRGEDVIVVQGTHPPQDINFVKLLLLVDAVTRMGAKSVKTVIPYMAYARQDRVFLEGEPVSIQALLKSLRAVGADEAITVNIHSPWTADQSAVKLTNIDASGIIAS